MWFTGKVYQCCHDQATALAWFERAYQINASEADVAREASTCAMELARHDTAIGFAHRAVQIAPANPGLHANLALAYLLAGRIPEAQNEIGCAVATDPTDIISKTIDSMTKHFAANGRTPPATTPALLTYWAKNRNA
jgi:tetratricopeptide (TPR) repeat protein